MKVKRVFALLTALVMILAVVPTISLAAGTTLTATDSYIASTVSTGVYAMDNFTNRPYAVSWSNATGYRMGVVAFDISALDFSGGVLGTSTLTMTASRTQNVNESGTSTIAIFAMDPAELDANNNNNPTLGTKVGSFSLSALPTQLSSGVNIAVSAEIDLSTYLTEYPGATKVALLITNRDDRSDSNSRGLVGFYGVGDTGYEPTLTVNIVQGTSAEVTLAVGADTVVTEVENLVVGEEYSPDEATAPKYIASGGKLYEKQSVTPIILAASGNSISVSYAEASSFAMFAGSSAALPETIQIVRNGALAAVNVAGWATADDISAAGTAIYTAEADGEEIAVTVQIVEADHDMTVFYGGGASNGAGFSNYNYLGNTYGSGNIVIETDFTITEGTNKLISFGDVTTTSFNGAGALLRYANAAVFEYFDTSDWKASSVPCTSGSSYRLRTEIDITNKTYRMYVAGAGEAYTEVTNGAAGFRNASLAKIDRMFFHGSGEGEVADAVTANLTYWVDGYSTVAVSYIGDDGVEVRPTIQKKATKGWVYSVNDAAVIVEKGEDIYILADVNEIPSKLIEADTDTVEVLYHKVSIDATEAPDANSVQGDAINMPAYARLVFSDGQSLNYGVTWNQTDIEDIDTNVAGSYTVTGTLEGYSLPVTCTVNIKSLTEIPYEEGQTSVATNNGGWNWYVEPSGTHIQPGDALANLYEGKTVDEKGNPIIYSSNGGYEFKHDRTYMGWVEDDGSIIVTQLDHETGEYKRVEIHDRLESDDHNNPAVIVLPNGHIMAVYTMHTNEPYMYFRITKEPEDISEWLPEQYYFCETNTTTESSSGYNATYPSVFVVHDDPDTNGDVIYAGWRGVHWKPTLAKFPIPDTTTGAMIPEGKEAYANEPQRVVPVMGQTQFANTTYGYNTYSPSNDAPNAKTDGGKTDSGRRPYTKYDYDQKRNKIYITFTANHPDNDRRNHVYYLYLDIADQNLYTAKDKFIQPLPKENNYELYASVGAAGTNGQWGVVTVDVLDVFPELLVFDASEQTGEDFSPRYGNNERRGWTWDIKANEKGEPCIVYVDVTATPPGEGGTLPNWYVADGADGTDQTATRAHHYYWYARWDSESQQWVKTFLTYGGKWFHQNVGQERCYSGGLTFDHNYPGNVIYMAVPEYGDYGNNFEIVRWESDDNGATWTKRQNITKNSQISNARPNAIYNYKMDEDGNHAGPRLLWTNGEYRYWMNYEYKTGVKTDYPGLITQDDPEMFADASVVDGTGEAIEALPVGDGVSLTAKFNITNISVGDGTVKLALAHYDKDNQLIGFEALEPATVPARSVPQIGMIGATKLVDDGSASPWAAEENRSPLGDPEYLAEIPYTADIAEGDRIALFAWNTGIEHPMQSVMSIPYSISTDGMSYAMRDSFSYDGTRKLVLDKDENTFNGWVAKGYDASGEVAFTDYNYVAITKAPFGNTGLHLYRKGDSGIMASHKLPEEVLDEEYTIEFTVRYINEISWNDTDNAGFTLSHGIPEYKGDSANASAYQFRHLANWNNENGRGTYGEVRNTTTFDGGTEAQIFHEVDMSRDVSAYERYDYSKGVGYYNPEEEVFIHDYNDSLMVGSLYRFKVVVNPELQSVNLSINDGYRTATHTAIYNSGFDWATNPVDTLTFSIGDTKWGEMYVDDFRVYASSGEGTTIRNAAIQNGGADLLGSATWKIIPVGDAYAFLNASGASLDVNSQLTTVGASIGTYTYNGGANQIFYIEETDGGYILRGKQSGLYIGGSAAAPTLQAQADALVFDIRDVSMESVEDIEAYIAALEEAAAE